MLSQIVRHVKEEARPARDFNADVPDGVQQVLNFMLAKDPGRRYPTPERAANALQLFLPNFEMPMPDKKPDPNPTPGGADIPVGKLVGGKGEKPAAPKPKAKSPEPPTVPAVPTPLMMPAIPPAALASMAPAGEFDVELVAIPCPPPKPVKPREQRGLFELDRRDFIMMAVGAGGTIAAVLAGLVLAKALQRKPVDETSTSSERKGK
jgi:hypothetical protein